MTEMKITLAYAFTTIVFGTLLAVADCDGNITCWWGYPGMPPRKVLCSGSSCFKAEYGHDIIYDCWYRPEKHGCFLIKSTVYCVCSRDLCNGRWLADALYPKDLSTDFLNIGGEKQADVLNTGRISTDVLNTGGIPVDALNTGGLPADILNTDGIPANILNPEWVPTDVPNTKRILADVPDQKAEPSDVLNTVGTPADILNTRGIPADTHSLGGISADFLNTGGLPADVLNSGGTEDLLLCWSGENNSLRKKRCNGSCYKTEVRGDLLYGCLYSKEPDGCHRYGRKSICCCNRNLCNTGNVPNKTLKL